MAASSLSLKNENGTWVVHFPRELSERAEAVNDYILAALLKRAIMVYRQLEAELLGHDYEELARRLGEDMTPLVVAVLRRDDLVAQVPDWRQRLEGVMAFYRQFDTVESMKAHIEAARASN